MMTGKDHMRLPLTDQSRVLVLTGAGVSAESGVPTFRGLNGLWEGHAIEEVASPAGFADDPTLVWRFYSLRREGAAAVQPNPGHVALARLEAALGDRFFLATQNVDGLHARAGSRRLVAMHGELFMSRCVRCAVPFPDARSYHHELPACPACGSPVRPHIVWFGEQLDADHLARISDFIEQGARDLVFLAVGTSGTVRPAAGLVDEVQAVGGQAWLVDLDPSASYAGRFDEVVKGPSGEVLPRLFAPWL
jgi:NAD-dependent deacetylase